jgi:Subtilase family
MPQKSKTENSTLWSLVVLGLALGLILSSCSQVAPENTHFEPQAISLDLVGLNGKKLFAYAQTNCPIDQFDIPGQGFRARGSSGGLAVLGPPYTAMPTAITSPAAVGTNLYNLAALSPISRNVTILVVDDFNGDTTVSPARPPVYKLGREVFTLPSRSRGLSTTPDTRSSQLDTEVRRLESTNQLSHGTLVMNHINALIFGTGKYNGGELDISDGRVALKNRSTGNYMNVWAVDTEDLDTAHIAPRMRLAILEALASNRQIVVNMSFSIVPCTVKSDFVANRAAFPTFESYAKAVATANDALRGRTEKVTEFQNRVLKQLVTPFDNDPLYAVIKNQNIAGQVGSTGGNLIYVAAAGNFGLSYSMYPAAWPEVVSASSNDAGAGPSIFSNTSIFSNKGEVMLTGAWYTLTDPANINGVGFNQDKVVYAGTSFSSPALSVFSAFDIARTTPKCESEFDTRTGALVPDIAHTYFDNKPLIYAISAYCD